MSDTGAILDAIEKQTGRPVVWVTVPGRDNQGALISTNHTLVGHHKRAEIFFPETGEVANYAYDVVTKIPS